MPKDARANAMIDLLMENEKSMAELYAAYAQELPDMWEFWTQLVIEEKAHADVLNELREQMGKNTVSWAGRAITQATVTKTMEFVHSRRDKALSEPLTPLAALTVASVMEKTLLEKDFFKVFETDLPFMKTEFEAIRRHTEQHLVRIEKRLAEEKEKTKPSFSLGTGGTKPSRGRRK